MSKNNSGDMKLLDHLSELRKRLTVVVVVNFVVAMILFNNAGKIMKYLLIINPGMQLVYVSPSEPLLVYIELAFIFAIAICSPVTLYEIWAFVEKGLTKKEKALIVISLFFGLLCFVVGVIFCYFTVLPVTLQFFQRIVITEVESMVSIKSYASFVNMMLLSFGIVFEMPVMSYLLTKLEILKPEFLVKNRGICIVLIFIFAAIITPPDVISQMMLGIPMIILLEISIMVSKVVLKLNKNKVKDESIA
ncbi:MAG: twin-arginine translocase subunit TatC [Erysipelotrichaceae bacterium]|nr:twin-arginine translocase subunit TatC [Erysipelotrichaceae bacterium]MDY5251150.1 twin-arginine translocase subunit TatC [Erysipelotrichaceae bacterium]